MVPGRRGSPYASSELTGPRTRAEVGSSSSVRAFSSWVGERPGQIPLLATRRRPLTTDPKGRSPNFSGGSAAAKPGRTGLKRPTLGSDGPVLLAVLHHAPSDWPVGFGAHPVLHAVAAPSPSPLMGRTRELLEERDKFNPKKWHIGEGIQVSEGETFGGCWPAPPLGSERVFLCSQTWTARCKS